ncbi:hypothetical protein D3C84_520080 [compost metagenome]
MAIRARADVAKAAGGHDRDVGAHHHAVSDHATLFGFGVLRVVRVEDLAGTRTFDDLLHLLRSLEPYLEHAHALAVGDVLGHAAAQCLALVFSEVHHLVAVRQVGAVAIAGTGRALEHGRSLREEGDRDIQVDPLVADHIPGVLDVVLGRGAVPQHVAPVLVAGVDRLLVVVVGNAVLDPSDTDLGHVFECTGAVERRAVDVGQVLQQLGFALGRLGVFLAAGQNAEVCAPPLLAADDPVDGLADHVVADRRLAAILQLVDVFLCPLVVVVVVLVNGLLNAVLILAIELALVEAKQATMQLVVDLIVQDVALWLAILDKLAYQRFLFGHARWKPLLDPGVLFVVEVVHRLGLAQVSWWLRLNVWVHLVAFGCQVVAGSKLEIGDRAAFALGQERKKVFLTVDELDLPIGGVMLFWAMAGRQIHRNEGDAFDVRVRHDRSSPRCADGPCHR